MKRTLASLLLALLPLTLTACGDDDGPPDTTGDSVTENQQTQAPAPTPSS